MRNDNAARANAGAGSNVCSMFPRAFNSKRAQPIFDKERERAATKQAAMRTLPRLSA